MCMPSLPAALHPPMPQMRASGDLGGYHPPINLKSPAGPSSTNAGVSSHSPTSNYSIGSGSSANTNKNNLEASMGPTTGGGSYLFGPKHG